MVIEIQKTIVKDDTEYRKLMEEVKNNYPKFLQKYGLITGSVFTFVRVVDHIEDLHLRVFSPNCKEITISKNMDTMFIYGENILAVFCEVADVDFELQLALSVRMCSRFSESNFFEKIQGGV